METKTRRTGKALKNVKYGMISQFIKIAITFVTRTFFIHVLGQKILGVNSLFTNIISMLSLAELGISSAVGYSLYSPLSKNDKKTISAIMSFFRKAYGLIAIIVLVLGLCLIPFLPVIIKEYQAIDNALLIYLLFLVNVVITYLISYKEVLITADQRASEILKIQIISDVIANVVLLLMLLVSQNYILYLMAQIVMQIIYRGVVNRYITKKYNDIDFYTDEKIEKKELSTLKTNIKALFLHKIGDYCVNSTDNIIISAFISIGAVAVYTNYLTIITMLISVTTLIFNSLVSSFGNVIVTENKDYQYAAYKKLDFVGFIIYAFCTIALFNLMTPFIELWAGESYVMNFWVVILMIFNFYLVGMRVIANTIKQSAGIYKEDRYTPLVQALVNLAVSIILVQQIGVLGVVIGTVVSSIVLPSWQRPYLIYKNVFNKSMSEYIKRHLLYVFIVIVLAVISYFALGAITVNSLVTKLIIYGIFTVVLFAIAIIAVYHNSDDYKNMVKMLRRKNEK